MDGRHNNLYVDKDAAMQEWQQNAAETLTRNLERPLESQRRRPSVQQGIVRNATPESPQEPDDILGVLESAGTPEYESVQTSPRSIPGGEKPKERRAGLVFEDSYDDTLEGIPGYSSRPGPPVSFSAHTRPRTRTMEEPSRPRSTSTSVSKSRHRIGSVHSTTSSYQEAEPRNALDASSLSTTQSNPQTNRQAQNSGSIKKKDGGKGRLIKRSSRPASPTPQNEIPTVDSLPVPVATSDANRTLILMRTLCGRMKGEAEYQAIEQGPWYPGICYIDEVKGSLMHEGDDRGPFHLIVIENLRGCRVKPIEVRETQTKYLEISNPAIGLLVRLQPKPLTDYDFWLAALLCWQQIRNGQGQISAPISSSPRMWDRMPRSEISRKHDSLSTINGGSREGNIIKVGKLLLWDKGAPSSPSAIVQPAITRDSKATSRSWRRVSCVLQDNGEFKLLTENDSTLICVIQLSQLSRFAIQRLDKSVLDEDYCIAIFPQYTPTSTTLSIFRPVYVSLESRTLFEVWFVLLRAFSIPEIYGPQQPTYEPELPDDTGATTDGMFRIEKSLSLRIIEAKFKKGAAKPESSHFGRHSRTPVDPSLGDYFVEVMLDGEIRARTMTKSDTTNPFWREDCEFHDLPGHFPRLSVILKRMDAPAMTIHGFLSSTSVHNLEQASETICGYVDIPIEKLERGRDLESWWPIIDESQEQIGEMYLKIRHNELVVLLAKDYQPISELLHRFSTGLTIQIGHVVGQDLRKLSEILMNIFQVSGHSAEWLMALAEDEIDGVGKETPVARLRWSKRIGSNESFGNVGDREATVREMGKSLSGEANLLFRGNSLLTQALDFHMRRLGKEYLADVLGPKIIEITTISVDCEVDPSRLAKEEDATKNWTQLVSLTTGIWDRIFASVTRCPPEIRALMKYIRAVAEDRYGDFLRTVQYTSVTGFLFLRFFCPAILNPKLFGLLRDHPQPKAQRALTLVAKSLQVLANLSTFGQKEEWMSPMNKFLAVHRQDMKDYIDGICSIPAERTTYAVPASYSTPITILARLPPTSREGFPSLPYLIDHARNFAALVKMWLESTSNFITPQSLQGELQEFNEHCVALQRRTDECLLQAEYGNISLEQIYPQWDMAANVESPSLRSPAMTNSPRPGDLGSEPEAVELHSPLWSEYTANITAGRRSQLGSRGSEVGRKERQSFWESTFGKDNSNHTPKSRRTSETDLPSQSPPSRGQSRNSGKQRSFLSGLRRKGTKDSGTTNLLSSPGALERDRDTSGTGWHTGNGGMI
ncbi:Inhibitory regulator protein BUD2/CLA2 [Phlyctema vagabunda]|uniref:Inhibitory regulator protein BUD2/CLA2 n=1 Tax=Phlyctema vagabunda TaxID=108571 RepID=A0ABR4PLL7_9HELO